MDSEVELIFNTHGSLAPVPKQRQTLGSFSSECLSLTASPGDFSSTYRGSGTTEGLAIFV